MRLLKCLALGLVLAACSPQTTGDPLVDRGRKLAGDKACLSCHSTDGASSTGPTWKALFGSEVELNDGSTVMADEDYLAESIRDPSAKTVKGYEKGLMATIIEPGSLTAEEIEALVAYMKSLR